MGRDSILFGAFHPPSKFSLTPLGRSQDQRFIVNFIVMSRNVMSCHVMPLHVTSCHVTSCYVMPRQVTSCTSCHVIPRHVTSCHVMLRHVMSRLATLWHVKPRNVTSWHVMSRRKSWDGHTTNASLSTDFFHTQLIQIRHNCVRWLSRRVPIPYRISGILSSLILYLFYKILNCDNILLHSSSLRSPLQLIIYSNLSLILFNF